MLLAKSKGLSKPWFNEDITRDAMGQMDKDVIFYQAIYKSLKPMLGSIEKLIQCSPEERNVSDSFEQIVKIKRSANQVLTIEIISNLVTEIKETNLRINKLAVDYVLPYIYFWFEIEDNDFETCSKIEELIKKLNNEFKSTEFVLKSLINEKSLELEVPDGFLIL